MTPRPFPRSRGFTLLEALIALVVVAVGLVTLVGVQLRLSRDAEVAKQRTEAARLAQEKLEELRTFTQIDAGAGVASWEGLAAGDETVAGLTSNTSFTRSWTLGGAADDTQRPLQVSVAWANRASDDTETLTLNSVVSRTDPETAGSLAFPREGQRALKRPKNRSLNIPVPSLDLGDGRSVYQFSSDLAVVFSNDTGYVVMTCPFEVEDADDLVGCNEFPGYLLAGYVSGSMPTPLGIDTSGLAGLSGAAQCTIGAAKDVGTGESIADYRYYMCVLPVAETGHSWSGKIKLTGMNSGTSRLVCRYQYPAVEGMSPNERNVQPYVGVHDSLDTQNYKITTASTCPTESVVGTGKSAVELELTLHQNCRSSNPSRATDCPAA